MFLLWERLPAAIISPRSKTQSRLEAAPTIEKYLRPTKLTLIHFLGEIGLAKTPPQADRVLKKFQ
jgi:hypothetical protein